MRLCRLLLGFVLLLSAALAQAQAFDHTHAAWNALLGRHVKPFNNGNASAVDYSAIKAEHAALKAYLSTLTAVSDADFGKPCAMTRASMSMISCIRDRNHGSILQ